MLYSELFSTLAVSFGVTAIIMGGVVASRKLKAWYQLVLEHETRKMELLQAQHTTTLMTVCKDTVVQGLKLYLDHSETRNHNSSIKMKLAILSDEVHKLSEEIKKLRKGLDTTSAEEGDDTKSEEPNLLSEATLRQYARQKETEQFGREASEPYRLSMKNIAKHVAIQALAQSEVESEVLSSGDESVESHKSK